MKNYLPHIIKHIYLNEDIVLPGEVAGGKGFYFVFWWHDIALGQLFIDPGKIFEYGEYVQQIISAIKPAVKFYQRQQDTEAYNWEYWLQNQLTEEWNDWMKKLLAKWNDPQVPYTVPVSLIICTRNRAAQLQRCLQNLKALSCLPEEIIVVDNAPTDNATKAITATFDGVKYVKEPRAGLDIARNTGIISALCDIVAFVDDDVIAHPLWAYRIWESFEDSSVAAITGLVIASELDTEAQMIFEKHWSFNRGYTDQVYDSAFFKATSPTGCPVWEIGAGANMAFRKTVFKTTGLFDELLDAGAAGCNGDSEMWFRILLKGHNIHYTPRAIVFHEHRKDMPGLKKQIFSYMRGFTSAVLIQQQYHPASGYKKFKLRGFIRQYSKALIKQFPAYPLQYKTLLPEIKGVLSGLLFYTKNKKKSTGFK
ncbi:MAG: glycosyltransferase [Aquabacterium sp.]|nr:glycosyltransferase [Ferruginibacter sp.]